MKVLMFSTDPKIFAPGSATRSRMREYAGALGELHIVVLARQRAASASVENLFLYPASGAWGIGRLLRAWRTGWSLCRRMRFDVVSAQSPDEVGLAGLLLARLFRIPFQIQVHTDIYSPWYRSASWKERIRYFIARFLIPRADCIRVVSERIRRSISLYLAKQGTEVKRTLLSKVQSRISVQPVFTNITPFLNFALDPGAVARFPGYEFRMIAVGRFVDKEKNFSMLIEMMREFVKICPKALLALVGDGPDRENYKLQIINYKLERNVVIESWRDDLPSFYKSFDLFLLRSNYEGWGMAAVEAMAAGLPVVMTDVGLAGEIVRDGENGMVVPVGDADAFLAAVSDLYANAEKRKKIAAAGQKTILGLSPKTKEEHLTLYRKSFLVCLS